MRERLNAIITSARLGDVGRGGYLDFSISLDYGNSTAQGFGGYALYLPKSFDHHDKQSCGGHFIWRILEVAGVSEWSELRGKTIRVDADRGRVYGIGHIVKENWFYPETEVTS